VNAPATENVTLEVGVNTETVEVSAQATALNTTDASLGNAFNETQDPNNGTIVSAFSNGSAAQSSFVEPFPGLAGQRNNLRGPGFFGFDTGLSKRWTMPWGEGQSLQFSLSALMP